MDKKNKAEESSEQQRVRPVTYSDIGKQLGVSKMTVSLAMRNHPRISETTRIRVQEKAAEMNYQVDPMLSALANYRFLKQEKPMTAELAWINLNRNPEELRKHEVFNQYWKGAFDTARQFGFCLEEFSGRDIPLDRMDRILKARGIRGILLAPTLHDQNSRSAELDQFPWQDYSTIRFGESFSSLRVDSVSSAQVFNAILVFNRMLEMGYKRIGFIGEYSRKRLFSAGYLWGQQALQPSRQLTPLYFQMNELTGRQLILKKWMNQQKPDAIISGGARHLELLERLGYQIPDDIGLATLSRCDNPINAGIDQNPEEIGRVAIRSLVAQLNENRYGISPTQKEILVEGLWVDGSMLPSRL